MSISTIASNQKRRFQFDSLNRGFITEIPSSSVTVSLLSLFQLVQCAVAWWAIVSTTVFILSIATTPSQSLARGLTKEELELERICFRDPLPVPTLSCASNHLPSTTLAHLTLTLALTLSHFTHARPIHNELFSTIITDKILPYHHP
jgi:hypothetical protein